jgi:hypothetical protein
MTECMPGPVGTILPMFYFILIISDSTYFAKKKMEFQTGDVLC